MKTLKQLRKENKLTQQDLAIKTGVHYTTISKFEKGQTRLTDKQLIIFEEFFGEPFLHLRENDILRAEVKELKDALAQKNKAYATLYDVAFELNTQVKEYRALVNKLTKLINVQSDKTETYDMNIFKKGGK